MVQVDSLDTPKREKLLGGWSFDILLLGLEENSSPEI